MFDGAVAEGGEADIGLGAVERARAFDRGTHHQRLRARQIGLVRDAPRDAHADVAIRRGPVLDLTRQKILSRDKIHLAVEPQPRDRAHTAHFSAAATVTDTDTESRLD